MSWLLDIDPFISVTICLTLVHSIWQSAALLLSAEAAVRLVPASNPGRACAIYTAALLVAVLAVPITYQALASSRTAMIEPPHASPGSTENVVPMSSTKALRATVLPSAAATDRASMRGSVDVRRQVGASNTATWLLITYIAGVWLMLVRLAIRAMSDRRARRQANVISAPQFVEPLDRLCRQWRIRHVPLLTESSTVAVPRLAGLIRPVIVLPSAALTGLSRDEAEMILAHELAHLRRGDLWVNFLQRLAEAVLFFNPSVWLLSHRVSRFREYCCDDLVCRATSRPSIDYARLLVGLAESVAPRRFTNEPRFLAATGERPSELRHRLARLLGEPISEPLPVTRRGLMIAASVTVLLFIGQPVIRATAGQGQAEPVRDEHPIGPMKRAFKAGPVVELLGIGEEAKKDSDSARWWDVGGNALSGLPLRWTAKSNVHVSPDPAMKRRVAIRLHSRPEGAYMTWRIRTGGATGTADAGVSYVGMEVPDKEMFARLFTVADANAKSFNVSVGIAAGPWTTSGSAARDYGGAMGRKQHSLVFSRGFEVGGSASVIVSHDYFDDDIRVVAFDKQGTLHPQQGRGGHSAGRIYQCQATFPGLPLSQVDRFEFQTRPYEWVEFKDLPLNPID